MIDNLNYKEASSDWILEVTLNQTVDGSVNYESSSLVNEKYERETPNSNDYSLQNDESSSKKYEINTFYAELGGYVIKLHKYGKYGLNRYETHGLVVAMYDLNRQCW